MIQYQGCFSKGVETVGGDGPIDALSRVSSWWDAARTTSELSSLILGVAGVELTSH